jgi:hypothetical protein
MEVDIYPLHDPGGADLINGALGDGSQFHLAYGYYARGVGPETAKAPAGWRERLVKRDVPPRPGLEGTIVAWCLEVHDLVLSTCAAGRERDWDYAREALRAQIGDPEVLLARVPDLPLTLKQSQTSTWCCGRSSMPRTRDPDEAPHEATRPEPRRRDATNDAIRLDSDEDRSPDVMRVWSGLVMLAPRVEARVPRDSISRFDSPCLLLRRFSVDLARR